MASTSKQLYLRAITDHWLQYTLGVITLLLTSGTEVAAPKFVQWTMDLLGGRPMNLPALLRRDTPVHSLHALVGAMACAFLIGMTGRFGWRQLLARRTHMAGRDLKVRFWRSLRDQPLSTFHRYSLGDLMNRATGDWAASRAIHGFTIVATLDMVFFTVLAASAMLLIDWRLTLVCLAVFPFLPRFILRLARLEHEQHHRAQEMLSELSGTVSQAVTTIRLQRATGSDSLWQERLTQEAKDYAERRYEVVRTGWRIFPLGAGPTLLAYGILLTYGIHRITIGELSLGQFIALQSYVLMLQGPLFDMGDNIAEWQRGLASLSRLVEIFNLPRPERQAPSTAAASIKEQQELGARTLALRHLTFAYADAKPLFASVSLTVAAGEKVGVFGPIGAGKSTMLTLLAGLTATEAGQVYLDGVDVQCQDRAWLAEHATMVPQKAFLFAGSVRQNLNLDQTYSDEHLWEILGLVGLGAEVQHFSGGLEAWVGEGGLNLSGGQKQRLALARALLRRRPVLLLDDCLSAVDAVTEEAVLRNLKPLLATTTVLWVAHRRSTLKLCDRLFELEDGSLRAVGASKSTVTSDVVARPRPGDSAAKSAVPT